MEVSGLDKDLVNVMSPGVTGHDGRGPPREREEKKKRQNSRMALGLFITTNNSFKILRF